MGHFSYSCSVRFSSNFIWSVPLGARSKKAWVDISLVRIFYLVLTCCLQMQRKSSAAFYVERFLGLRILQHFWYWLGHKGSEGGGLRVLIGVGGNIAAEIICIRHKLIKIPKISEDFHGCLQNVALLLGSNMRDEVIEIQSIQIQLIQHDILLVQSTSNRYGI